MAPGVGRARRRGSVPFFSVCSFAIGRRRCQRALRTRNPHTHTHTRRRDAAWSQSLSHRRRVRSHVDALCPTHTHARRLGVCVGVCVVFFFSVRVCARTEDEPLLGSNDSKSIRDAQNKQTNKLNKDEDDEKLCSSFGVSRTFHGNGAAIGLGSRKKENPFQCHTREPDDQPPHLFIHPQRSR